MKTTLIEKKSLEELNALTFENTKKPVTEFKSLRPKKSMHRTKSLRPFAIKARASKRK